MLVELKQPGRTTASRDDPVSKTLDYVAQLKGGRAKTEGGAVIDIEPGALTTVYILADWTADFRSYLQREDFREMPGDVGRYRYRSTGISCSWRCRLPGCWKARGGETGSSSSGSGSSREPDCMVKGQAVLDAAGPYFEAVQAARRSSLEPDSARSALGHPANRAHLAL